MLSASTNNAQPRNRQAVIIALLAFYGRYFAFYGVLGVVQYVYMVCAIVAYTAFICVLLAFGFIGMVLHDLPIASHIYILYWCIMVHYILCYAIHTLYIVAVMPCIHYILICYILILYVVVVVDVTTRYSDHKEIS